MYPKILCLALFCSVSTGETQLYPEPPTSVGNETPVKSGELPFMAALRAYSEILCGGAILDSKHVLTAAHCLKGRDLESILVVLGVVNITIDDETSRAQEIQISKAFEHAKYRHDEKSQAYDLVVLRLKNKIKFTKHIRPICFPSNPEISEKLINRTLTVAGWEKTDPDIPTTLLLKTNYKVMEMEKCRKEYIKEGQFYQDEFQLCSQRKDTGSSGNSTGGIMFTKNPSTNSFEIISIVTKGSKKVTGETWSKSIQTFITPFQCYIETFISTTNNQQYCRGSSENELF